MWFSVELMIAGIVYLKVREFLYDTVSVESLLYDIQPSVMALVNSSTMQLISNRTLAVIGTMCPTCVPPPIQTPDPSTDTWTNWVSNVLLI
jgi:hypothetical protein